MRQYNKWTNDKIECLKKYYPISSEEDLLKLFPEYCYSAIRTKASSLGIKKKRIDKKLDYIRPKKTKPIEYTINKNGCHICTSHFLHHKGYPAITRNRKTIRMNRYIYELNYGEIPNGLLVCHKCDTPSCINPEHLFLGTNADNMRDMVKKGRQAKGEDHPQAKLTKKQVVTILKNKVMSSQGLATVFNMSNSHISKIRHKKAWKSIKEVTKKIN